MFGILPGVFPVGDFVAPHPHLHGRHPDEFHGYGLRHPGAARFGQRRGRHQRRRRHVRRLDLGDHRRRRVLADRVRHLRLPGLRHPVGQRPAPEPQAAQQGQHSGNRAVQLGYPAPFGLAASAASSHPLAVHRAHEIRTGHKPLARLDRHGPAQRRLDRQRESGRQPGQTILSGRLACQQFPRQNGQGILVAGGVRQAFAAQFRRQVRARGARAHRFAAGDRQMTVGRQAEIRHPHHAVLAQIDVRRLEIAVNDVPLVGEIQRRGHLLQHRQHLVRRAPPAFALPGPGTDVHPGGEITDQIDLIAHIYQLANGGEVRMGLVGNPLNARVNDRQHGLGMPQIARQSPQRDILARLAVVAAPQLPQVAGPQHRHDFIAVPQHRSHPEFRIVPGSGIRRLVAGPFHPGGLVRHGVRILPARPVSGNRKTGPEPVRIRN